MRYAAELHSAPELEALPAAVRLPFLRQLRKAAVLVKNVADVKACRDSKDDKFLGLPTTGRADLILSGEQDPLPLHVFVRIQSLSRRQYLTKVGEER